MGSPIHDNMMFQGLIDANFLDGSYFGNYESVIMYDIDIKGNVVQCVSIFCPRCSSYDELFIMKSDRGLFEYICECGHYQIVIIYDAF